MNCPFFFKGWCRKFNGACSDVRNCGFKKGAARTGKTVTDIPKAT